MDGLFIDWGCFVRQSVQLYNTVLNEFVNNPYLQKREYVACSHFTSLNVSLRRCRQTPTLLIFRMICRTTATTVCAVVRKVPEEYSEWGYAHRASATGRPCRRWAHPVGHQHVNRPPFRSTTSRPPPGVAIGAMRLRAIYRRRRCSNTSTLPAMMSSRSPRWSSE